MKKNNLWYIVVTIISFTILSLAVSVAFADVTNVDWLLAATKIGCNSEQACRIQYDSLDPNRLQDAKTLENMWNFFKTQTGVYTTAEQEILSDTQRIIVAQLTAAGDDEEKFNKAILDAAQTVFQKNPALAEKYGISQKEIRRVQYEQKSSGTLELYIAQNGCTILYPEIKTLDQCGQKLQNVFALGNSDSIKEFRVLVVNAGPEYVKQFAEMERNFNNKFNQYYRPMTPADMIKQCVDEGRGTQEQCARMIGREHAYPFNQPYINIGDMIIPAELTAEQQGVFERCGQLGESKEICFSGAKSMIIDGPGIEDRDKKFAWQMSPEEMRIICINKQEFQKLPLAEAEKKCDEELKDVRLYPSPPPLLPPYPLRDFCPKSVVRNEPGCYNEPTPNRCSREMCPGDLGYDPSRIKTDGKLDPIYPPPIGGATITYPYTFVSTGKVLDNKLALEGYCSAMAPGSGSPGTSLYTRAQAECVDKGFAWGGDGGDSQFTTPSLNTTTGIISGACPFGYTGTPPNCIVSSGTTSLTTSSVSGACVVGAYMEGSYCKKGAVCGAPGSPEASYTAASCTNVMTGTSYTSPVVSCGTGLYMCNGACIANGASCGSTTYTSSSTAPITGSCMYGGTYPNCNPSMPSTTSGSTMTPDQGCKNTYGAAASWNGTKCIGGTSPTASIIDVFRFWFSRP